MDGPKCLDVFGTDNGIVNSEQCRRGLSLMLGDIAAKRITNSAANAINNTVGKICQIVKLEHQYGDGDGNGGRLLKLVPDRPALSSSVEIAVSPSR